MCRELPVARPDCKRMSAHLRPPARSLHLAPARESGLERCFHTDSSREFMDLDCTQQGILFSDERKNIQQPVFALGVLDTLPCFGIRHMRVVGVELLSAGQNAPLLPSSLSSPPSSPGRGRGARGWCGRSPGHGEKTRGTPARQPPGSSSCAAPGPRFPARACGAAAVLASGEPAPAWGPLTACPVEYCISWL